MKVNTILERDFAAEAQHSRELVRDLHQVRPLVYWTDLLATAFLGWGSFIGCCFSPIFSLPMLTGAALAVAALYRGLCFVHEISHLNPRAIRRFETIWNLLFGYPLLMPAFVYCGVHQSHHKLSTYGTKQDPEYMSFAHSSRMTVIFALESFFIPFALLLRFLVLTPVGLLFPPFHKWLVTHASSLTMNLGYRRETTPELETSIREQSAIVLLVWTLGIGSAFSGLLPWHLFAIWLLISSLVSFVNTLRTLGAHAYESDGDVLDRQGQLLDSIDTPGAFWTELWAPVGLRYHALHHYFPGIPYHNLGKAHRRLAKSLPNHAEYHKVRSPSLLSSLRNLYRSGTKSRT